MNQDEIKNKPENDQFGERSVWMLLNRNVVDDVRLSVYVMGISGKGVVFQTRRQHRDGNDWGDPVFDAPVMADGALIIENFEVAAGELKDADGKPLLVTRQCIGREVLHCDVARERLQPGKDSRDRERKKIRARAQKAKNDQDRRKALEEMHAVNAQGPQDHLQLQPGAVLTTEYNRVEEERRREARAQALAKARAEGVVNAKTHDVEGDEPPAAANDEAQSATENTESEALATVTDISPEPDVADGPPAPAGA